MHSSASLIRVVALRYRPAILTATVLLYLAIGYYPFQLQLPVRISDNSATYSDSGVLQLLHPGIVRSNGPPPWLARAIADSRLAVTLEIKPLHSRQYGPARILTMSRDPFSRNLTVAQLGTDLVVRLRNPAADLNGLPAYRLPGALATPGWHRVEIRITPQRLQVKLDSAEALSAPLPEDALADWAPSYRLALGNELSEDRPWLGEIRVASVSAGAQTPIDYSRPGALQSPRHLAVTQARIIANPFNLQTWSINRDFLVNLLGFIPLGALFVCLGGGRQAVALATAACASLSLGIELGQLFFAGRVTETADLMLNTLGGALGAWLAWRLGACRHAAKA